MGEMFSSVSMMKVNYVGIAETIKGEKRIRDWPASNFVLTKEPTSYVTIDYHNGEGGPVTGSLKIVVLDEPINKSDPRSAIFPDTGGLSDKGKGITIDVQTNYRSAYYTLTQTNTIEYPVVWKYALHEFAKWYCDNKSYSTNGSKSKRVWGCETPESIKVVRYVKTFYDNLKKAMPGLMAYRFQNEVFAKFTNHANKSIVDYDDPENTVIAKAIPVMKVSGLKDLFANSFNQSGNFEGGKQFTYSYCIVDLNPNISDYNSKVPSELADKSEFNLGNTQFPMSFADGVNVNVDEYKTKKLVLTRVDKISGEKCDTFTMGSNHNDYDLIVDPKKRKYKDDESIVDGATDDLATVKLGNGGSYQKKHPEVDLTINNRHILDDDLYDFDLNNDDDKRRLQKRNPQTGVIVTKDGKPIYESKYFKNKHFFLDPFALTIAQWCYVKLNSQGTGRATTPNARAFLSNEGHLEEIQRSYWRYVCVWGEKGEWDYWKARNENEPRGARSIDDDDIVEAGDIVEMRDETSGSVAATSEVATTSSSVNVGITPTEEDERIISELCDRGWYDPLQDTRPYYYATYNDVRSTGAVYFDRKSGGTKYIIDSAKGDEFQLVKDASSSSTSFMDILNNNVVFQTQKRIYGNHEPPAISEEQGHVKYFEN